MLHIPALCLVLLFSVNVDGAAGGIKADNTPAAAAAVLINRGFVVPVYCSGAIISTRHVLTSARCCWDSDSIKIQITGGTIVTYGSLAETYYAEAVFYDQDPRKIHHLNPCIMKASRIIKYKEHLYPLGLASVEDVEEWKASNDPLLVLGWGQVTAGWKQWDAMEYLNKLLVPRLDFNECLRLGFPTITADLVKQGVICVGYTNQTNTYPLKRLSVMDIGAPMVGIEDMKIYGFSASYYVPEGLDARNKVQYPTLAVTMTERFLGLIEEWMTK